MILDPTKPVFVVPFKPSSSAKIVRIRTCVNRQAMIAVKQLPCAADLMPMLNTLIPIVNIVLLKSRLWIGLSVVLAITACQPVATDKPATDASLVTSVTEDADSVTNNEPSVAVIAPTADAQSSIDQHEAEFIAKMLALQQRQLQEADAPLIENSTSGEVVDSTQTQTTSNQPQDIINQTLNSQTLTTSDQTQAASPQPLVTNNPSQDIVIPTPSINPQNATFADLPLLTAPMPPPEPLSAAEIQSRYKVAMQSLYLPDNVPLAAGAVDTLLNIATLMPDVFAEPQLATRLVIKLPALARLLKQYQTWQQVEAQQSRELVALKQQQIQTLQQQEKRFNELVADFNERIKGYDEQINKYEKKLAEF